MKMIDKKGWEKKKLGEVCLFENGDRGINYPSKSDRTDVGIPFVNAGHLYSNGIDTENMDYISREKFNQLGGGKFKIGDLLFCLRGSVGKYAMNKQFTEGTIASSLVIIRPNSNLIGQFLKYYFESKICKEMIADFGNGAAQPNLSAGNLKKFKILLPPVIEQHQIVSELDALSDIISKKKQQLEELDKLAQATFYDMFGDPVTNEKGWEIGCLKNYTTKIGSGSTPTGGNQSYKSEGISLIRSMNVLNGSFKYKDLAYIDDIQAKQLDNVTIQKDDVLINITGASVARSCIVPENILPARVNQHVSIIRLKMDLNSVFVNSLFISPHFQIKLIELGKANGATREAITKSQLEILEIPIPPISMQNQFATKIKSIEKQKSLINQSIDDVQQLFDYTMDKYFV
jgi:type I restriction enzyme, S subunit